MATLAEMTELFTNLALHLQALKETSPINQLQEENDSLDLSILNFTQSLNLTDNSRVRVLDTALSLLCFKAPKVFDSMIEYLVKTIISVLSSSINYKVLRFEKEEVLQIGCLISGEDCSELVEVVTDVITKLEGRGMHSHLLLQAVVKAAVSASCCRYCAPSMHIFNVKTIDKRTSSISKLVCYLPRECSLKSHGVPLRLLFWHLDSLTLKRDITEILQDTMKRPFLSLSREFSERMDWRSILICLVLSPIMFINTRALLHEWFLLTGLDSILELLIELVSAVLDVIFRPTFWGLSIEWGSKLPFSNAYFPYNKHMPRIFAGPISYENFLQLVDGATGSVALVTKQFGQTCKPFAVKVASIDHKSIWALAITFPDWFYFASILLFSEKEFQENFILNCAVEVPSIHCLESLRTAAARYIAWILRPINKSHQLLLFDSLTKISDHWTRKKIDSGMLDKADTGKKSILKKQKRSISMEDFTLGNKHDSQFICLWLKEFHNIMRYNKVENSASFEAIPCPLVPQHDALFRRIPLGILIGFGDIDEDGYELLLHYVTTGRIFQQVVNKHARIRHVKHKSGAVPDPVIGSNELNIKEAEIGACLVFRLTDIVERMSASLCETEETGLDFIYQVKLRAGGYLIKCIKRVIQSNINEDGIPMLMDLHCRLKRWRPQGQEVLQLQKDLDDTIKGLNHKLSSL